MELHPLAGIWQVAEELERRFDDEGFDGDGGGAA